VLATRKSISVCFAVGTVGVPVMDGLSRGAFKLSALLIDVKKFGRYLLPLQFYQAYSDLLQHHLLVLQ
jgi:hypothetical protein